MSNSVRPICSSGTYAPEGKYLWDAWFINDGEHWHMFHLQADMGIPPIERHHNASIGHAISKDLVTWEEQPTALEPGPSPAWDDLALWTGSVIRKDNTYYMFYTGRTHDNYWGQNIGVATSENLIDWQRHGQNPILEADGLYCPVGEGQTCNFDSIPAWRDPFVDYDESTGQYIMVITSRLKDGKDKYDSSIGFATSDNLIDWKLQPPLLAPHMYEEMETPQLICHNGDYHLFFSAYAHAYHPDWAQRHQQHSGLHCFSATSLTGNYKPVCEHGQVFNHADPIYAPRIIEHYKDNLYVAIGWLDGGWQEGRGSQPFLGRLSCSFLLELTPQEVTMKGYLDVEKGQTTPEFIDAAE